MSVQTKNPARKSWRDALQTHEAANLFPLMAETDPDALKELGEDIKKNGQRQPIAIIEKPRRRPDGTLHVKDPPLQEVLDGISRLDAMELAGIRVIGQDGQLDCQIQRIVIDTDEIDPVAYVISANIHRRHLSAEQKRDLIAKLIRATPEKSDRQIADTVKASPTTVGTVRAEIASTVQSGQLPEKRVGKDGKARKQPSSKPRKPTTKPQPARKPSVEPIVEAEAAAKPAPESKSASRCSICRERKRAVQRSVFICDDCVHIFEVADAAPPDDGLDIPACLDRTKQQQAAS